MRCRSCNYAKLCSKLGSAPYTLDLVGLAIDAGINLDRGQNVTFSADAGFTGRTVMGDITGFRLVLANGDAKAPVTFGAFDAGIQLVVNKVRFFVDVPLFFSTVEGLNAATVIIGGGLRGDLFPVFAKTKP